MSKPSYLLILLSIFFAIGTKAMADEIKVTPDCLADNSRLVVFTLLNIDYTVNEQISEKGTARPEPKQKTTRQIWKIDCSLKTSACSAAIVTIDKVERGQKLNLFDMILPESIYIASRTKNVFTIAYGPFITLTVDIASGRVDYRESGPDVEGRGVAYCR